MTPLPGRNVLLTGASGGLGRHIAHALVRAGASVALAGRNAEALDSLALELRCHPGARAEPLICDLTEPDAPRKLAAVAETALGPIDVLVNDAAVELAAPFTAISAEELERILLLDLTVPLQLIRVLLPGMLARHRGHVVNVSSIGGKGAVPYSVPYAAAKWGLIGVTRSLRAEYIDSAVGFSVVCPGFVTGEGIFARAPASDPSDARVRGARAANGGTARRPARHDSLRRTGGTCRGPDVMRRPRDRGFSTDSTHRDRHERPRRTPEAAQARNDDAGPVRNNRQTPESSPPPERARCFNDLAAELDQILTRTTVES